MIALVFFVYMKCLNVLSFLNLMLYKAVFGEKIQHTNFILITELTEKLVSNSNTILYFIRVDYDAVDELQQVRRVFHIVCVAQFLHQRCKSISLFLCLLQCKIMSHFKQRQKYGG